MGQLIVHSMYPGKQVSDLQESDKQIISALSTLAAGLAGGVTGGSSASALAGAQAGKNAVENNALTIPAPPVPVPGVPVGPGDQVKQDADKKIASGLEGTIKDLGHALDKATQCSFGRACSSENGEEQNQPNIGKDFSDADKAELGGKGSGTPGGWEPQDEENARDKENGSNNNFDRFKKDDLISSANEPINEQGLSAAARAWEKYAGRPGGVFEPLKGNPTQKSKAANQFVNEVLNNKSTIKTELSRGGVEYRLPDGRGVRYNSDGSFSGFLDPKKPR
ncbi:VENN motif pre-toxin domain-containing protein [Pantoea dispersa]|uniref:VENN motif pre-toxin domain-containing protein n=1 Tax=Pantoea dispersa TaxID=59814 RepID=UPI000A4B85A1|nr:VENN motif pre-toxin domain-containing protein [Pantoea dispersa]